MAGELAYHPLTSDRWDDLVDLFGPQRGACGGCWCMWPRIRDVEFRIMGKTDRRAAFEAIVRRGPPPGLLAYDGGRAIGWVAISPRSSVHRFNISKNSAPVNSAPVNSAPCEGDAGDLESHWAITCFYIRNGHRGQGLTASLATAAIAFARANGAVSVEACAIEPRRKLIWGEGFVGLASIFPPLGFVEIARRSPSRPLFRLDLGA